MDGMFVYKKCKTPDGFPCIVKMFKSSFTPSTEGREDIVLKEFAQYRCKEVEVVEIEDMVDSNIKYSSASNYIYNIKVIHYEVGKKIIVDDYDCNENTVCSTGIHYYLNKDVARSCNETPFTIINGRYLKCFETGEIIYDYMCDNKKYGYMIGSSL